MQYQDFLFFLLVSLHVFHVEVIQANNGTIIYNGTQEVFGCKTLTSQGEGRPSDRFAIPISTSSAEEDQLFEFLLKGKGRLSILLHTSLNQLDNETYIIELTTSEAKILKTVESYTKKTITYTSVEPEALISTTKTTEFWIKITPLGYIQVGKMGDKMPFIMGQDLNPLKIKTFSFSANEDNDAIMYYDCDPLKCKRNKDCAKSKVCMDGTCKNPCEGTCGNNTDCRVFNNIAVCQCRDKHIGNPREGCTADPDTCKKNKDCLDSNVCVEGTCVNVCANACGNHTICKVQNNVAICTCQENYSGDPRQNCEANTKKYTMFTDEQMNWFRALEFCTAQKMRLATIESEQEYLQVRSLIDKAFIEGKLHDVGNSIWLGGSDLGEEGTWMWTSTGNPMHYSRWSEEEPNNKFGEENCLELRQGYSYKMNDVPCSFNHYFVCEY